MATFQLTTPQIQSLDSIVQRFELYVAFVSAYQITATSTAVKDFQTTETFSWKPVPRTGPNRVGIVNEVLSFYGGDSYVRGGGAATNHSWDFGDGQTATGASVSHAYANPGIYLVQLTVTGPNSTSTGKRWVRIFAGWGDAYDDIAEVRAIGASLQQGGWRCELRVTGDPTALVDRAGVIIYAKDKWQLEKGEWTENTVGMYPDRYDPHIVMTGYLVGDTVRFDPDNHDITFEVRTPEYFLQNTSMYAMDFWTTGQNGFGHFIDNLTLADALQHVLMEHTNFAEWHDVILWQNENNMRCCTLNEGSIWSWVQDMAKNEFGQGYCSKDSSLFIVPNVNVRGLDWWGSQDPPVMDFNVNNLMHLEISEQPDDRVGYVEINASQTVGGNTILTGKYPAEPSNTGNWEILREIMSDDEHQLNLFAKAIYRWRNARYTGRLTTGLNHALDLGQVVTITVTSEQ